MTSAHAVSMVQGSLWIDCRHDGIRAGGDPPLPGAAVDIVGADGSVRSTVTDSRGRYRFLTTAGRTYTVELPIIQRATLGDHVSPIRTPPADAGRSAGVLRGDTVFIQVPAKRGASTRFDLGLIPKRRPGSC